MLKKGKNLKKYVNFCILCYFFPQFLTVWAAVIVGGDVVHGVGALLWRDQVGHHHNSDNNNNLTGLAKSVEILHDLTQNHGDVVYDEIASDEPVHYRLERQLMSHYNNRLIPRRTTAKPIQVLFTIGLYQIIEVNEPQQYILLNSWIVERWRDDLLHWDADQFGGLKEIVLPRESVWIPDTTLYNSLVMDDEHSRRILNVKFNTLQREKSALAEMLYPTLYQFSCMLDLRFFPYDIQHCVMTFGSWSHDNKLIDYYAYDDINDVIMPELYPNGSAQYQSTAPGGISIKHCIPNEGWNILSTEVSRREVKFHCCENNYTLLEFKLHIQRKPLFYLVNLIIPTSIITLIAIVGFFSSSTVNDIREEKISLGITTLLSMSILIFMVSDQMPSTSSFIPLIGWFYTSMMALISGGTLAASMVIYVQKKGIIGQRPSRHTMRWARRLGKMVWMEMPLLMKQAYAIKAKQDKIQKIRQQLEQQHQKEERRRQQLLQQQQQANDQSPRKPTFWHLRNRIAGGGAHAHGIGQRTDSMGTLMTGLGATLGKYRTPNSVMGDGTGVTGNGGIATTSFVGPTLGHAFTLLVPQSGGNSRRESTTVVHKDSSDGCGVTVGGLKRNKSLVRRRTVINEEASDELDESSDDVETSSLASGGKSSSCTSSKKNSSAMDQQQPNNRTDRINLIDMEEDSTAPGTPTPTEPEAPERNIPQTVFSKYSDTERPEPMMRSRTESVGQNGPVETGKLRAAVRKSAGNLSAGGHHHQQGPPSPTAQTQPYCPNDYGSLPAITVPNNTNNMYDGPGPGTVPNLENPLVANAMAAVEPLQQWSRQMLERHRELERLQAEMGASGGKRSAPTDARRPPRPLFTRRSTSQQSMADLYAATLFPPTPAEYASSGASNAPQQDPGSTLAEASARLSTLHPQVQRNLAEIEYDWLAAVVERLFLLLFCSLFFLMSFGINGIGLYYWYFTLQDMIEGS